VRLRQALGPGLGLGEWEGTEKTMLEAHTYPRAPQRGPERKTAVPIGPPSGGGSVLGTLWVVCTEIAAVSSGIRLRTAV
jgi:hypothetical protein